MISNCIKQNDEFELARRIEMEMKEKRKVNYDIDQYKIENIIKEMQEIYEDD